MQQSPTKKKYVCVSTPSTLSLNAHQHHQLERAGSRPIDLDDTDDILPTDRTDINLAGTSHTSTDMATVIEQGILLLTVADLAQIHLLVGDFPVADALAVAFAVLVAADVFIAGFLLDEGALAVALVLVPVPVVGIPGGVLHGAAAVALAEDEVAGVGGG